MKAEFKVVIGYKLDKSRTKSLGDEYKLYEFFIPIFHNYDKEILNFRIIFDLKLPLDLTNLKSGKYVIADAVIVGE